MLRRLSLRLMLGLCTALVACISPLFGQTTPTAPWSHSVRSGDIVYFAFASPARIERYDLAQEIWLNAISLTNTPTALHVDASAIYLAYDRTITRRTLSGTGEVPLYNAPTTITAVLTDASYIFVFAPAYSSGRIDSLRKSDGQFVSTWSGTYSMGAGFSIAPTGRRIYGVNNQTSSFSTIELPYNANGTFGTMNEVGSNGSYSNQHQTWVAPGEKTLVRSNGIVYSVPTLVQRTSLAGSLDDAAFHGTDVLIGLRGKKLLAFDNSYLEAGSHVLSVLAHRLAVRAGQIYAFSGSSAQASGIGVEKVAVTALTAAQPGAPVDPAFLSFAPDEVQQTEDGALLLLSKKFQSIFRWSPTTRTFTASYPLLATPVSFAYSTTLRRIYTAYSSGAIYQIKLDTDATAETPFVTIANQPGQLLPLNDLLLVADTYSSYNQSIFDREGVKKNTSTAGYGSNFLWSSAQRRLYYYGSSPVAYATVDTTGQIGTGASGPYNSSNYPQGTLRLSSDSSSILGMNGLMVRTSDLTYSGSLSNAVLDAASRGGNWVSIRAAGAGTQLQTWTSSYFMDRAFSVVGVPYRVFVLPDSRMVVLTTSAGDPNSGYYGTPRNDGRLIFSIVDLAGSGSVASSPHITAEPASLTLYRGKPGSLIVSATGGTLTYQWRKNGAEIAGATNATLTFATVQDSDVGSYAVVVSNAYGSAISAVASVSVEEPPAAPTITSPPQSVFAALGNYVSFYVSTNGTLLTYQWRKGGTPIAGATSSGFNISSVTAQDFASYDVVVSNPGGSATSNPATLAPTVPVSITTQPLNQATSPGGGATFTIAATGAPTPTYRWQRQAAGASTWVNLSNSNTFNGALTATLTIANATLAMNGDQFRCLAFNGSLEVASAAATLAVTNAPLFTSPTSATFYVGTSNSFVIKASGSPAPTFSAIGVPSWAALDPVTGVLSGTPPGTAGAPFTLQLSAVNGTLPNASQLFTLYVQPQVGAPVISAHPQSQSAPAGAAVTFSVLAGGADPLTYQWKKDDVAISGATNSTYAIPAVSTTDAGRYTVTVSNGLGSATSQTALLGLIPAGVAATHNVIGPGYVPGENVTIANTVTFAGNAKALGWQVLIPEGWSLVSVTGSEGDIKPAPGATQLLEWAWTNEPPGPVSFNYTLKPPLNATGDHAVAALVSLRLESNPLQLLAKPDPLMVRRTVLHSADTSGDGKLSLFELVRIIELYNTRNGTTRTGSYKIDLAGEDGFAPDTALSGISPGLPYYHNADSNHDAKIGLLELTRVIELYNYRQGSVRTGAYHASVGSEDGFAPGP